MNARLRDFFKIRLLWVLFATAGMALGVGTATLSAEKAGTCAPGYPVCSFSAECSSICIRLDCQGETCSDDEVGDCYRCSD